jgi:hypothetical protein
VKHGAWLEWLENNFAWSERSAQHYMAAAELAAKYENVADLKLRLTGFYALGKYDEEMVAAVLKVAQTRWLNGEGVDRVAEEFRRSKNANCEAEEQKAETQAEEQVDAISAVQAKATAEQEAEGRTEAETMLDAPPPELPSSEALPRDEFLTSTFQKAIEALKGIMTKPAVKFVSTGYSAADLELVADFLNHVAVAKTACGVTAPLMGNGLSSSVASRGRRSTRV